MSNEDSDLLSYDRNRPRPRRSTIEFPTQHLVPTQFSPTTQPYVSIPTPTPQHPATPIYPQATPQSVSPNQLETKILSQLSLIETIDSHLNQKKICKLGIPPTLEASFNNILVKIGNYPNYVDLLTKLKIKFKCEICLKNPPQLVFKCGHSLCGNCFCSRLGPNVVPPAFGDPRIQCFICRTELEHSDYSYFFVDWEERMKAYDIDMRRRCREELKCKGCKRVLRVACFAGCKCFCYECQLLNRSLGNCECGSSFNYVISCDYCKKKINTPYAHPYTILCSGHICCETCMPQLFDEFICKICKKHLTNTDVRKLTKFCIKECNYCKKKYSSKYFLSNNCCQAPVCILCQYTYHKTCCVLCHRKFDFSVDDYMQSLSLFN